MSSGLDESPTPAPISSFSDDPSESTLSSERFQLVRQDVRDLKVLVNQGFHELRAQHERQEAGSRDMLEQFRLSNERAALQIGFMERKEQREIEALKREEARRDMSKEAAAKRLEEDLAERRANRGWLRNTADRALVPFIASILGGVGTLITGLVAWSLLKLGVSP